VAAITGSGTEYVHVDALGSSTLSTNATGATQSATTYDAFGNSVTVGATASKFGYTGHETDHATGLVYFKARHYDPELGKFISADAYEGEPALPISWNAYLYANGNPLIYIDREGYAAELEVVSNQLGELDESIAAQRAGYKGATGFLKLAGSVGLRALVGTVKFGVDMANLAVNAATTKTPLRSLVSSETRESNAAELQRDWETAKTAASAIANTETYKAGAAAVAGTLGRAAGGDMEALGTIGDVVGNPRKSIQKLSAINKADNLTAGMVKKVEDSPGKIPEPPRSSATSVDGALSKEGARIETAGEAVATKSVVAQPDMQAPVGDSTSPYASLSDEQFLHEIARRAEVKGIAQGWGPSGSGAVQGTKKHSYAEKLLDRYQTITGERTHLLTEDSWLLGVPVPRGTPGSSRPDVFDPLTGTIYDYKFVRQPGQGIPATQQAKNLRNVPGVATQFEINP
jgi:RHS repeat-associated protein